MEHLAALVPRPRLHLIVKILSHLGLPRSLARRVDLFQII
jgi:hypothetical protein